MDPVPVTVDARPNLAPLLRITHIVYALMAAYFFFGITAIVAVIINYVKLEETRGTWLESHFRWQIGTFWLGLIGHAIGWVLMITIIGFPLAFLTWAITGIWILYRVVKGWLYLNDGKPLPT
jgi:uncharacterized membrane protein